MPRRSPGILNSLAVLSLLAACGSTPPQPAAPTPTATTEEPSGAPVAVAPKSLYERLGGRPAIEGVVGEFVARLASDPRVKFRFANSNVPNLTRDLVDFVCLATGGNCEYQGREMTVLHARMHVTEEEWDATVEALVGALDKFSVPAAEKKELLGAIGPLKAQIVDPPKEAPVGTEAAAVDEAAKGVAKLKLKNPAAEEMLAEAFKQLRLGNRSYADQLFSMAEVEVGADKLEKLAPRFRQGSPPRITSKPKQLPMDQAPQPTAAVGSSDEDDAKAKPAGATLSGTVKLRTTDPVDAFGVVMLTPASGKGKQRTAKQRVVEQRGRTFAPRLIAVPVGSTIAFPNFDDIYHNVFSRSATQPFDLGLFKNGQARDLKFTKAGIVRIGCNLHANMATAVVVVDAPHYVVTDEKGAFKFASLKPGKYKARAWTDRSTQPVEQDIEIAAGDNTLELDLENDAKPGVAEDKFGAARGGRP